MSIYPELQMLPVTPTPTPTATTTTTTTSNNNDMERSVLEMERKLNYSFKNKKLLEEALTHPSYTNSTSYQRLEFIGDAVLKLAFANCAFFAYPNVDESILHLLCSLNTTNQKLARVALYHDFYPYVRRCDPRLDAKVQEFALVVEAEGKTAVYGDSVKAPKVLADIVESILAAVYFDCDFDLKFLWEVIKGLLEPFITLETLPLQLVTLLNELCQKQGKKIEIRHSTKLDKNICCIYVDSKLVATGTSDQKDIAELKAAGGAFHKLNKFSNCMDVDYEVIDKDEIKNAKQKLNKLCDQKKWPKPTYSRVEQEMDLGNDKKFKCRVKIEIEEVELIMLGDVKSKIKEAENSAASVLIHSLEESNFV